MEIILLQYLLLLLSGNISLIQRENTVFNKRKEL